MKTQTKTKEEKLKLARKYFIQQKLTEISLTLLLLASIIFIPYFIGNTFSDGTSEFCAKNIGTYYESYQCGNVGIWFIGAELIITLVGICLSFLFAIGLIIFLILSWIECNWERAKRRAGLYDKEFLDRIK